MASPLPRSTVQLVHNPLAGSFSAARLAALEAAFMRTGMTPSQSISSPGVDFQLLPGIDHLCIAGGDGTVRHVMAALAPHGAFPPISIYPMGTINLVAREWSVPGDPDAFVRSVGQQPRLNPVQINDTYFVACASIGPDARAVAGVSDTLKRRIGRAAYGVAMAREFVRWSRPKLTLLANGEAIECEAIYIANGRYFAGPWSFAPDARVDQPQIHCVALKTARRRDFLRFMYMTLRGKTDTHPNIIRFICTTVSVDSSALHPVQADGDIITALPVKITSLVP
jgi:diacylglycerol kinase (ATP)